MLSTTLGMEQRQLPRRSEAGTRRFDNLVAEDSYGRNVVFRAPLMKALVSHYIFIAHCS